ncbi:MAG: hypothetical protein AAGD00_03200 [Planctomycetota bacterium]
MPARYDLDAAMEHARRPIDAGWSRKQRMFVGVTCAVVAVGAASAGGWFWWSNRPVSMPTSAYEAIEVMNSPRYESLSQDRKLAYTAEAMRLFREMPPEDREQFRGDEQAREAFRETMMQQMDEGVRTWARTGQMDWSMFRPPRGERPRGERRERPEGERPSAADRRERFSNMLSERFSSGNAQMNGLHGEFWNSMRGGGGGRRGGGGR